jgi:hypothetical protein
VSEWGCLRQLVVYPGCAVSRSTQLGVQVPVLAHPLTRSVPRKGGRVLRRLDVAALGMQWDISIDCKGETDSVRAGVVCWTHPATVLSDLQVARRPASGEREKGYLRGFGGDSRRWRAPLHDTTTKCYPPCPLAHSSTLPSSLLGWVHTSGRRMCKYSSARATWVATRTRRYHGSE